MNDEAALWAAIKAQPGESTPKLALADWYEENGNPVMAHALKWCVARRKWPYVSPQSRSVWWGRFKTKDAAFNLPQCVFDAFRPRQRSVIQCRSEKGAIERLGFVLDQLLIVCKVPPQWTA